MNYQGLNQDELQNEFGKIKRRYLSLQKEKYSFDLSRGKQCTEQLDLSMGLFDTIDKTYVFNKKADYRNYGSLDGVPELKNIFANLLGVDKETVFLGGNSSLNLIYDVLTKAWCFGVLGGTPWCKIPKVKFLCPVPGYDRHFAMLEQFGIEMIAVPMDENGPDMELVEELVASDISIKGMFCVPRFSNPSGIVYSDEVVRRLATMKTAAVDFRIFWDNAYCVHALYPDAPELLNIFNVPDAVADRVYMFISTSKMTFSSGGTCCLSTSERNLQSLKKYFSVQTINFDKVNQYEHALFFKDVSTIKLLMDRHAAILRPKFEKVQEVFNEAFQGNSYVHWTDPKGGYFVTLYVLEGTAKRVNELCKKIGITLTETGAAYPLHIDDLDSTIRIAPSYISVEDLETALKALAVCVDYAILEKILDISPID